jgi:hypothetical protein
MRGRVCLLYMLLALASAVFLVSEFIGTRDRISLSQIWDFPFRRLRRLAGSRGGHNRKHHLQQFCYLYGQWPSDSPDIVSKGMCLPSRCSDTANCLFAYCIATAILIVCLRSLPGNTPICYNEYTVVALCRMSCLVPLHRDIFKATDEFTALCFTVTGALPAVKGMQILPMTQHAWRPITFGMKENN